jgi:hypothetical protein
MKPFIHSDLSAKKFGGKPEDYSDIHNFMDMSKMCHADVRHRAILHNTFGCYIAEMVFGETRTNSEGKVYSVRDIAEQHVLDDLGQIPTLSQWLEKMPIEPWMGQPVVTKKTINLKD